MKCTREVHTRIARCTTTTEDVNVSRMTRSSFASSARVANQIKCHPKPAVLSIQESSVCCVLMCCAVLFCLDASVAHRDAE